MARTESNLMPLGISAPNFSLPDTRSDEMLSLLDIQGELATVIMFICNHCPYVKHIKSEIARLANDYQSRGISFVAISSNDATQYPADGPDKMKEIAKKWKFDFPYLYDKSQEVAQVYKAACTPDIYVFDDSLKLVYHGQLDDSRPKNDIPVTGRDVRAALDALIAGVEVNKDQTPSVGCNIKWKENS
ncbi:MAG: thioredoxin family protein [Tunicatimonas sp.]|uniref:thioredoxin family protein n=1 Tax=Tunicatimonas sp. TaxID=1940096 RepID=UPI003C7519E7